MKHFKLSEFDSPDLKGSGSEMDLDFLTMLDMARNKAGTFFFINSGYRTKEHNDAIKASKTSSHLKGLAADISCGNSYDRLLFVKCLIEVGFTRIGIGKTFIHVDNDKSKPDSIWLY